MSDESAASPAYRNANGRTALLARLRSLLLQHVQPLYEKLLGQAAQDLFELAKVAPVARQKPYLDAMRLVQAEAERLSAALQAALEQHFELRTPQRPDLDRVSSLALKDSREVERLILRAEAATRAAAHYEELLSDLQGRMAVLCRDAALNENSLLPAGLFDSFLAGLSRVHPDPAVHRVLLQLFERRVLLQLQPLYSEALEALSEHGLRARPLLAAEATPRSAPAAAAGAVSAPQALDAATAAVLQRIATGSLSSLPPGGIAGFNFLPDFSPAASDAQLAGLIMQTVRGESAPGITAEPAAAIRQRALLVGRMFNEILADPQFPPEFAHVTEAFRFPVLKAALVDSSFFQDPVHPVRTTVNEMASRAAAARLGGRDAIERFERWAEQTAQEVALQPQAVQDQLGQAAPLASADIERFMQQQAAQGQKRRSEILARVRQTVEQELELNTVGQHVPPSVQPLLRAGWAPMMARHLLQEGAEGPSYKAGMELLHRILFALNPQSPNARSPGEREALRRELMQALTSVGMAPARARELIAGLDDALDAFKSRDIPGLGAATPEAEANDAEDDPAVENEGPATAAVDVPLPSEPPAFALAAEPGAAAEVLGLEEAPSPPYGPLAEGVATAEALAPSAPVTPLPQELPSPQRLLEQLLKVGTWFRVYDRNSGATRWLKLVSWFPHVQRISFAEFDGTNALTVHVRDFLEDLLQRRSDPIDIAPHTLLILQAVRKRYVDAGGQLPDINTLVA